MGEDFVRAFLREFPSLVLTKEQQDWLAEQIDKEYEELLDDSFED